MSLVSCIVLSLIKFFNVILKCNPIVSKTIYKIYRITNRSFKMDKTFYYFKKVFGELKKVQEQHISHYGVNIFIFNVAFAVLLL